MSRSVAKAEFHVSGWKFQKKIGNKVYIFLDFVSKIIRFLAKCFSTGLSKPASKLCLKFFENTFSDEIYEYIVCESQNSAVYKVWSILKKTVWKKNITLLDLLDFEQKIGLWAKSFQQRCQNCIPHVQRNLWFKNFFKRLSSFSIFEQKLFVNRAKSVWQVCPSWIPRIQMNILQESFQKNFICFFQILNLKL